MKNLETIRNSLDILKSARELLSDKSRWTSLVYARTFYGEPAPPTDCMAVKFCALGAVINVSRTANSMGASLYLQGASSELYKLDVASLNDALGYEHVLCIYDKAIEMCEKELLEEQHQTQSVKVANVPLLTMDENKNTLVESKTLVVA